MQSQVGTPSSLAAMGHNPLLAAAFTAQHVAHQAVTHGAGQSGGALSQIHPAFLHPFYQLHPSFGQLRPVLAAAAAAAGGQAVGERPGSGGKSFTIDAILGRDGKLQGSDGITTTSTATVNLSPRAQSAMAPLMNRETGAGSSRGLGPATAALGVLQHRQHRLQSAGHPYLTTLAQCTAPLGFRSTFSSSRDKTERKSCHGENSGESDWGKAGKAKRVRTIFTPEQLERLEAEFERQQYMVGTERYYLAASLNLTEAQVKVWFQNRRIKWRKTNLEIQHQKLKSMDLLGSTGVEGDSDSECSDLDPANESENSSRSHELLEYPPEGAGVLHMGGHSELSNQNDEHENKENEDLLTADSSQEHKNADICDKNPLQSIPQS